MPLLTRLNIYNKLPWLRGGAGYMGMRAATALIFKVLGMLLGYGFTVYIAWAYGPRTLGTFLLSFLIIEVVLIFSVSGMDTAVLSLTSRANVIENEPERYSRQTAVLLRALSYSLPVSVACNLSVFLLADIIAVNIFHSSGLTGYIRIMSFGIMPITVSRVVVQFFRGQNRIKLFSILNYMTLNLGFLGFIFIIGIFFKDWYTVPAAYLMSSILLAIGCAGGLVLTGGREKRLPGSNTVKLSELTVIARSMFFADMMEFAKSWMGTFFIGFYLSRYYVGIYGIAAKLASAVGLISLAVGVVVMPKLGEFYGKNDWQSVRKLLASSSRVLFTLTSISIAGIIIFGKLVLDIIGKDYGSVYGILIILSLAHFVNAFLGSGAYLLQVVNRQRAYGLIISLNTIAAFIMYIILIPAFGMTGAAAAEVFFSVMMTVTFLIYIKSSLSLSPWFIFSKKRALKQR